MTSVVNTQIQIDKSHLEQCKTVQQSIDYNSLGTDQVVLEVESFGFSANNITYALMGDKMGYWGFFPADDGYGILPIWGFATVVFSNHSDIKIGEKVFGYLPMASHIVVTAGEVSGSSFYDVDPARKSISSVYDQYVRCAVDPGYRADKEDWQLNFRPLFMTSFVLDDYVGEHITENTKAVILTSASSKTAYGAGFLLKHFKQERGGQYEVIGLTSAHNVEFTKNCGCYDNVLSYEDYAALQQHDNTIILDFAGNKPLLLNLQSYLGDAMQAMIFIGATDVESQKESFAGELRGELFFAPSQVKKRTKEWGGPGFMQKYAMGWHAFSSHIEPVLSTTHFKGVEAITDLYRNGLEGKFETDKMYVVTF